jgi:hypothetical protein
VSSDPQQDVLEVLEGSIPASCLARAIRKRIRSASSAAGAIVVLIPWRPCASDGGVISLGPGNA